MKHLAFRFFLCCAPALLAGETFLNPPAVDYATLALFHCNSAPLVDSSLAGNRPVEEGLVLGQGIFGQAIETEKTSRVYVPLDVAVQPRDAMTLECWMFLRARGGEKLARVVGRSSMYGFYITGAKERPGITWYVRALPDSWKSVSAPVPLKKWTHVAGTFDSRKMRLFINGKLAAEKDNPGLLPVSRTSFYIGSENASGTLRFLGLIDEIRFSKVARTEFMTGKPLPRPKPTTTLVPAPDAVDALEKKIVIGKAGSPPTIDGKLDDAVWQTIPAENLFLAKDGSRASATTTFQMTYDDQNLYIAYRCNEKGQETWREGPARRDDTAIFKADCVETLVQPGGRGATYFQIAANSSGGIFDVQYPRPRKMLPWVAAGLRSAGQVQPDLWTVELAIPFKDLSVPPPQVGTRWRGNLCRTEQPSGELTTWSFTGGGYHVLSRFGILEFAAKPQATRKVAGIRTVAGNIVNVDGSPARGVPVRTAAGYTRTDVFGDYKVKGLPEGPAVIQVRSPRYHSFTGQFEVKNSKEVLPPIVLKEVDPYIPAYSLKGKKKPVTWLNSSLVEPPDMENAPGKKAMARKLMLQATPGEYESCAIAFYSHRDLKAPRARVIDLAGPAHARLESHVEVRWTQRLLKRVQYRRLREDAVYSWRFLWHESPEQVPGKHLRQLVITIKVPLNAPAGNYRGRLVLSDASGEVSRLPVELEVLPFHLARPRKRVGCYYRGHPKSDDQIRLELADIRDHGGSLLIWHAPLYISKDKEGEILYDTSAVRHAVELQKKFGIGPPFIVGTSPRRAAVLAGLKVTMSEEFARAVLESQKFREIYGGGIKVLADLEKELGAGGFAYTWMDEVFGRGRFEPWRAFAQITRQLSKNRIYITFHNRNQAMVDKIAPYVDIRGYHGHTIDWWLGEGHTFEELKAELDKAGDEAWNYYNIRDITVTSEYARLCNGYWLWRSPLSAHTPWTYYSFGGSAFDDLDSDHHDFAYAAPHPTKPEMVSTLEWECFREGYDDLRYLASLEQEIHRVRKFSPTSRGLAKAVRLRQSYWDQDPRVPVQAEKLTAADYAQRRRDIASAIISLRKIEPK